MRSRRPRPLALTLGAALGLLVAAPAWAQQDQPEATEGAAQETATHSGEVVSAGEGKLTMTVDGENRHTHNVADNARITIDGKRARLDDLKPGDKIRVTTPQDNRQRALAIAATRGPEGAARAQDRPRDDRRQADDRGERPGEGEAAQLGVLVAASPNGVFVMGVQPEGPAEEAGIRRGDYILAVGETRIATPQALQEAIRGREPGSTANLTLWSQGEERQMEVKLAAMETIRRGAEQVQGQPGEAAQQRQAKAWLGVGLDEEAEQPGAAISRVFPAGPAARFGFEPGDTISAVDGEKIESSEQLVEKMEGMEPGKDVEFTIQRDGESQKLTARLGERPAFLNAGDDDEALQQFGFRDETGIPEHAMMLEQHRRFAQQHERIEGLLHEVLGELETLREDVRRLKGGPDPVEPADPARPAEPRPRNN